MRRRLCPLSWTVAALAMAAVAAASCDSNNPPTIPEAPGEPLLVSVDIIGPSTIPPGETVRFSARGKWSNGELREITTGIAWQSANPNIVSIDASGTATGGERGSAAIRASVTGRPTATMVVYVMPQGTFLLYGKVHDTSSAGFPIDSAAVEADSNPGKITAVTNVKGEFVLYGVRPDTVLRVSKDGYRLHEQPLNLTNHTGIQVALTLAQSRLIIAGTYTLSIGSPQCEGASRPLAEEWRQRTYTAVVTQNDGRVTVKLSGGEFRSDRFFGVVTGTGAIFDMTEGDYYYSMAHDVVERLSNGTFLAFTGRAIATPTPSGLAGTFNGSLINLQSAPFGVEIGRCVSGSHPFTLTADTIGGLR